MCVFIEQVSNRAQQGNLVTAGPSSQPVRPNELTDIDMILMNILI